ncbi:MAG TPA: DNA adenine methylase [Tepidisphaeraceae bacterium]|nr:DNA adenine methylase [Tepidisphaeraceae bacterium]
MSRTISEVRIKPSLFDDETALAGVESHALRARFSSPKKAGGKKIIAFGWYGGKYSHLDWLVPLLPKCHHYCEPLGGSAAVLLNRAPYFL